MNEYFGFRNLRQFEQKQREVRLPCDLLNDERFRRLADARKAHLICLLLLAARMGNLLPNRPAKLGSLIGATEPIDVDEFSDFIRFSQLPGEDEDKRVERRPLSDTLRALVLVRDGGRCRRCGSARNLEVDHIVPLSRGGDSEDCNLQTLCRRCNRRKWKKLVPRI
jgi:5-methylcytosine-specific restriction endonuclease McrA